MILLYFIKVFLFEIKTPVIISTKDNPKMHLVESENNRVRLKIIQETDFKAGDKNVVEFEPSSDLFMIKFSSGKYLFKPDGEDIEIQTPKDSKLTSYDPLEGFKFDIKTTENGYKFEVDGLCLEKGMSSGIPDEFHIKALNCSDSPAQLFDIKTVQLTEEKKDMEGELPPYEQEEGPTINPIIHGANNKRDPYMYGNEPYRGRGHRPK